MMIGRGRALAALFGAFLCRLIEGGLMKSFGVLLTTLTEQWNIMVWQYGNTVALMHIVGSFVTLGASPLMKVIYPRYLLIVAGCMIGSGFILAAISSNWAVLSVAVIFTGIGIRISLAFSISLIPKYFTKYYLLACGIAYTGGPLGTVIFAPLSQLFLEIYGWRSTMLLLGAFSYNAILCGVLVKPHPIQISVSLEKRCNKEDDDKQNQRSGILDKLADTFDLVLFKDYHFLSLMICDLCVCLAWQGWLLYLIPHGEEKGLSPWQSSGLAVAGGVGFLIGLIMPSILVDTGFISHYQARTVAFSLMAATFLIDPWINSFLGQMFLSFFCTSSIGVGYTVSMAAAMNVSVGNIAQVVSFSLFVSSVGKYIGGTLTGLLFDVTGSYNVSFLFIGGMQFVAALCSGISMLLQHRDNNA